ncbi:MAG: TatD family hydrolase [Deltaproteobacteria bacterium]|nr:TatD family hydrolase [Deltaproteobacteria bacterium]
MLVDTHAHLDMPEFARDLPLVIQRAKQEGIFTILTVGTEPESCRRTLEIAEAYKGIFAILGVHPHHAADVQEGDLAHLKDMAHHEKVRAWGEVGLDFYRNLSPPEIQQERFRQQITIGKELRLPLVIHSRQATKETLKILQEERAQEVGGVIHCFSGDEETAKIYLEMDFYISISGVITFKGAHVLREVVKRLTLDRILLETDAPFLAPVPHRGKRNEPAYVRLTAQRIAEIRKLTLSEVAAVTTDNARRAFNLDKL